MISQRTGTIFKSGSISGSFDFEMGVFLDNKSQALTVCSLTDSKIFLIRFSRCFVISTMIFVRHCHDFGTILIRFRYVFVFRLIPSVYDMSRGPPKMNLRSRDYNSR